MTRWVPHELRGEPWLAARFTIAPLRLPAFSVTWFRVESDRARHQGAYRLRSELVEAGSIPGWLLLLGAMGLHVYGEGDQIIVQDRPGQGEVFDAYRLLLLEVFIAWNVDHTVAGSPVEGEPSELRSWCGRGSKRAFGTYLRCSRCQGTRRRPRSMREGRWRPAMSSELQEIVPRSIPGRRRTGSFSGAVSTRASTQRGTPLPHGSAPRRRRCSSRRSLGFGAGGRSPGRPRRVSCSGS